MDDEIYSYLLKNAQEIGESASDILHRLLNLPSYGPKYQDNTHEFEKVLAIQGRGRIYIAKSKEDIERSGNSTQPRTIPSSLKLLGYSAKAINSVTATIR